MKSTNQIIKQSPSICSISRILAEKRFNNSLNVFERLHHRMLEGKIVAEFKKLQEDEFDHKQKTHLKQYQQIILEHRRTKSQS